MRAPRANVKARAGTLVAARAAVAPLGRARAPLAPRSLPTSRRVERGHHGVSGRALTSLSSDARSGLGDDEGDDPDDYSSPSGDERHVDEDDYELADDELESETPSTSSSSISAVASAARSRLGRGARRLRARARRATADLPDDLLGRALWLWESRPVSRVRLAVSVAAASARAPALLALVFSQAGGVVASTQLSLPVVAPLLIGLPVLARSVAANASAVAPRAAAAALLLWLAWFANRVATSTALYLRRQGALDARLAGAAVACSEVLALSAATLVMLSAIGVNVSALLLPAALLAGWAAADGARCFGAGAFLFAAQPFRLGDRVAVRAPSPPSPPPAMALPGGALAGRDGASLGGGSNGNVDGGGDDSWFDGRVESVDLRYTVVRKEGARLFVPNSSFLTREFVVFDREVPTGGGGGARARRERRRREREREQANVVAFPPSSSQQQQLPVEVAPSQSAGWSNYGVGSWQPTQQGQQAQQQPPPTTTQAQWQQQQQQFPPPQQSYYGYPPPPQQQQQGGSLPPPPLVE